MALIQMTQEFNATPEQVWPFITSPTAVLDELGIDYESEPIEIPGFDDAMVVTVIEKGKPHQAQTAVVESDPPGRHRTLSSGGFIGGDMIAHNDRLVLLEPIDAGTRVTIIQNWAPENPARGPVAKFHWRLTFWLAKSHLQSLVEGEFATLQRYLERSTG